MAGRLEGKRALVTGGSRGIGRGIALSFAGAGADVAIGYRREKEKAEEAVKEVEVGYWKHVTGIDLDGVFHTLHAALPILREQNSGVLLTISSIGADLCGAGGGPYVAAKAAINALTKVVARENAGVGVRANVIAPGLVETDIATGMLEVHGERLRGIVPLGRLGQPRDIGELAVYLASDDAEWVTGKIFRIDGGQQ